MPDIFDAIADPTRRALLQVLRDRLDLGEPAVAVTDFVEATGASRQSANRHLAVLTDVALLTIADDGPHRTYSLDAAALEPVEEWLAQFVALAPATSAAVSTPFSAWSGAETGGTIGRAVAERAFGVRSAVEGVAKRFTRG